MLTDEEPEGLVPIHIFITVYVDGSNEELWDAVRQSKGLRTFSDVVRDEVASNLDSLTYVRHFTIMRKGGVA
jgi:hypothetical protein